MPVPSFDPRAQNEPLLAEIKAAVARVLESGRYIGGDEVVRFEEALARHLGVAGAVALSSGSDALLAALLALDVGPGDAVVTTPFSYFATAAAIVRVGARPLFADLDPATLTLDPTQVEEAIERGKRLPGVRRVAALLPVHLFGRVADLARLGELSERHGLALVEDVAQAFGARYRGRAAGTHGRIGCFSFYPTKNLGGFGDGGAAVSDDRALTERLRRLRQHGQGSAPYEHLEVGGNFRLDALQCAALAVKLPHVARWQQQRLALAELYRAALRSRGLESFVVAPAPAPLGEHVYHQFVVRVPAREALRAHLAARGIGSAVYYPLPLHLQPSLRPLGGRPGDLPVAEQAAREVLALPFFPGMTADAVDEVVAALASFKPVGMGDG